MIEDPIHGPDGLGGRRLLHADLEEMAGGYLPRDQLFDISRYDPPGPVGAAYIRSKGPIDAIMGPGGSGKTVASVFKIMRFAIHSTPVCLDGKIRVKATIVRDNYRSLFRTTMATWLHWFPLSKYPNFTGGGDRPATHTLPLSTVRDGREVPVDFRAEFFAVADINYELLFKSYETTIAWATEADGVDVGVPPFFYGRTARYPSRDMLAPGAVRSRLCLVDFNPPDPEHPLLLACERGDFKEDFVPGGSDPRTVNFFVQPSGLSLNAENRLGKSLQEYQDEAAVLTRDQARRMVEGKPGRIKSGKPVYDDTFSRDRHVAIEPLKIIPGLPLHAGIDQGLSPAIVFFQEDGDGQIRVLAEVVPAEHGTGASRFLDMIRPVMAQKFAGLPPGTFTADPAGFTGVDRQTGEMTWSQAIGLGLNVTVLPAPSQEFALRRDSLEMLFNRNITKSKTAIVIDPSCVGLIRALDGGYKYEKYKEEDKNGEYARVPLKNKHSHVTEALQYGVMGVRGKAGLTRDVAFAGRPGNVVPFNQPHMAASSFDVWRT
jgi:hypothetical protein